MLVIVAAAAKVAGLIVPKRRIPGRFPLLHGNRVLNSIKAYSRANGLFSPFGISLPMTPGQRLRDALQQERPLQIVGTVNAYSALLAKDAGFRAIYLSGAGVANSSFGLPDLGMTSMSDVGEDIRRITAVVDLPLLVDADTGWGHELCVSRAVASFERAGAAGLHIEDQQAAKRCGHRPNKSIVSTEEMVDRILATTEGRVDPSFIIMARTDALANEGLAAAIDRCAAYVEAGADMIFAEALTDPEQYKEFKSAIGVPLMANMTEFGKTPLMTIEQFASVGVDMVLYPLSAFRAMSAAAEAVFQSIRKHGGQHEVLDQMQTRERLYEVLNYHEYEQKLDRNKGTEE